jgi:PRC-barrel domain protein
MALRSHAAIAALALVLATPPAWAEGPQQRPAGQAGGPAKRTEPRAVGLPVYTADGKAIGKIVATGTDEDNQPVLVAEIERPLGLGPEAIAIPADLFVRKQGRIELTITEAEMNARLER